MSRIKVDYGIDLGTTNSAICRMENGDPVIIKSDGQQKDTTPSCLAINKKKIISCGDLAYNTQPQIFVCDQDVVSIDIAMNDGWIKIVGGLESFKHVLVQFDSLLNRQRAPSIKHL